MYAAFLGSLRCAGLMEEEQRCMLFYGEPPLRGADGRGAEMYAFLGSLRCAVLMEEEQRSMLFWGASAARC